MDLPLFVEIIFFLLWEGFLNLPRDFTVNTVTLPVLRELQYTVRDAGFEPGTTTSV